MAEAMRTYREGERFPGRIGRTWEDSEPAFPMPPSAPEGAPNVLYVIIDDIGFGWTEPFGGLIRNPQHPAAGRQRAALHQLHHHRVVLTDPVVPDHRA
jgi:arylsulfatase A-like enzyme